MLHTLSQLITCCFIFTFFSSVFSAPHSQQHARLHNEEAWLRTKRSEVAAAKKELTCPNLPAPIDKFLDYSAKIRGQYGEEDCSISGLRKRQSSTDTYACDENNPCSNGACCAKSGYCGYGPASCGTTGTSPNDQCWSNCDAHAECGKDAAVANTTCPLNVCCSQYGFCGSTSDFCGTGCQSDCNQPDSGASGGDVQSRIIGYYESWAYNRSCSGMTFQNIPVGSLTHLHFSFGYITPGTFEVAPMDGVPADLFDDMTSLKSQNSGIKMIISLGGWSFNDNDTSTQPVYGDMVGSATNRATFISNLFAFMRQYAFDGVDFDWEYPGATDRGGNADDGVNYTQFLKELQEAISGETTKYVVSFTAPTSYWYLRHFDLTNMMQYVDYTNLMAYDLHGTWDSTDPIGSVVLAHTNLTEIDQALDLFWRNSVDPAKINLGLGFYGRSFQLADSSCWQPGCPFKAGGTAGTCTQNSGTLSYKEITQIIQQNNLTPYWDEVDAVKYLTWDSDQWVSYDDKDTFQQKIKYANGQGLGGLLIWAVDLDTDDLQALQAVIYPKTLNAFDSQTSDASYWQDATMGECRVTDCGGTCVAGEIMITSQPCGSAKPVTRHSTEKDSQLCCPLAAAPDPSTCTWRGTASACNGHCQNNEVMLEQNRWGSGDYCESGSKAYCCQVPEAKSTGCRITDCGGSCNSDEVSMAGYFYDNCFLSPKQLCCAADNDFTDCGWHGDDGSCSNNQCDANTQIQLAESWDGGGGDCGIHLERDRVFCCDPPNGESPFLPVPLDYLFPNPPTDNGADTEFKLSVDDTWGGKGVQGSDSTPNDAAFGFFVMTSPDTIQTSLDKRDGSHWELFDCFDSVSEDEQTIRMFCNDQSVDSNCHKISLGHGVPGTIIEMPSGCGPGRYAVAKDMKPSKNQTIPGHVVRRALVSEPVVYELTFDYDFRRVPRDLGDTQIRLDYSNQEGYWDGVVDKAGDKRRKRSLDDLDGSHKRWLEEAWREDHKSGLISRDELHARWFGSDVVDWLKGLLNVATTAPLIEHSIDETLTVILLDEQYSCDFSGVQVDAKLNVQAQANVQVDTSFGLTIIATLAFPPDLSNSYLYFKNSGSVSALFTIDALASASFTTGDIELFGLENFGATFSVPGILTVGPNFRIFGSVNADVTLAGHLESQVNLAKWDTQITLPDQGTDENPQSLQDPDRDGTQEIGNPTFNYSVSASGQITAHLKPTITFGLDFNSNFLNVGSAKVDLVADGSLQFYANAATSNSGSGSSFCYGAIAAASLYATVEAPTVFGWDFSVPQYQITPVISKDVIPQTCPIGSRGLDMGEDYYISERLSYPGVYTPSIAKRSTVIGPLLHLNSGLTCPQSDNNISGNISSCPLCDDETSAELQLSGRDSACYLVQSGGETFCPADLSSRGLDVLYYDSNFTVLESRSINSKTIQWTAFGSTNGADNTYPLDCGTYPTCGSAKTVTNIDKWFAFDAEDQPCTNAVAQRNGRTVDTSKFVTEHVYEAQLLGDFLKFLYTGPMPTLYGQATNAWVSETIVGINMGINGPYAFSANNVGDGTVFSVMAAGLGNVNNAVDLALAYGDLNDIKAHWLAGSSVSYQSTSDRATKIQIRNAAGTFTYLGAASVDEPVWDKFMRPSCWVDLVLYNFDRNYPWGTRAGEPTRQGGTPSLRWLYAKFIDSRLATIETNAVSWSNAASTYYQQTYPPQTQANKNWIQATFGNGGWATGANLKFPRVGGSSSIYGVYGNPTMTLDQNRNTVNIGAPQQ